uniref:S8 family serine peptidase n=2 Tax=Natrinema halophilum TaxID=1699371 RepID=A0A7D5GK17_9EURY
MCNTETSRRSVLCGIAGSTIAVGGVEGVRSTDRQAPADHEIYIVLGGGAGLRSRLESAGFEVLHALADGSVFIIQGPAGKEDELRSLAAVADAVTNETFALGEIERNERDIERGDEALSEEQWDNQLIRAERAHERATGAGTTLAVIDSGVSFAHPDLRSQVDTDRSRLVRDARIRSGTDSVTVASGPQNPLSRLNPIETTTQALATDVDGHGTHVAGIAAASRGDTGVVGVAPDASVVSLRTMFFDPVLEDGESTYGRLIGSIADILIAIDYAVEIGVDVVNASLRTIQPGDSRAFAAFRRVIQHAIENGTLIVVSAGNDFLDLDRVARYVLPADVSGAVAVGATGRTDTRVLFSNYGDAIDVAAPGSGILSTVPNRLYYESLYRRKPGTSMAAPQVAGLACLLREIDPDLHPRRVEQAIEMGAIELSGESTSGLGAGRIDAPAAIEQIAGQP